MEYALDGGVFTAGALLEWLSRDLGLADRPARARRARRGGGGRGRRAGAARLAGLGAPWWRSGARAVIAGLDSGARPGHVARAALEAIAWRVADVLAVVEAQAPVDVLRVDGGLTRDDLLLQMQADFAGRDGPARRGRRHGRRRGRAGRGGRGGPGSTTARSARSSRRATGSSPNCDADWREAAHADWRGFVESAADL